MRALEAQEGQLSEENGDALIERAPHQSPERTRPEEQEERGQTSRPSPCPSLAPSPLVRVRRYVGPRHPIRSVAGIIPHPGAVVAGWRAECSAWVSDDALPTVIHTCALIPVRRPEHPGTAYARLLYRDAATRLPGSTSADR